MYGADLHALQDLLIRFDQHHDLLWVSLPARADLHLRQIFWIGPDRDKTREAIRETLSGPIGNFLGDLRQARAMLAEAIATQHQASAVSGPGTPFAGPGQGPSGPGTPFAGPGQGPSGPGTPFAGPGQGPSGPGTPFAGP